MSVVAGVIIALLQLSSVLNDGAFKKGEAYLKFENEFASNISRQMGLIYEYHINREKLPAESYKQLYPLDQFIKARDMTEEFVFRLSACGNYGVCEPDYVDNFVCTLSQGMYKTLSTKVEWPAEWKIKFSEPIFYERKINEHCSAWNRFKFWVFR